MPQIRPSADVRNNYPELSKLCKELGEPIYITVNGKGDTALVDIAVLDELYARLDLYSKLALGIKEVNEGKVKPMEEVFAKFKK